MPDPKRVCHHCRHHMFENTELKPGMMCDQEALRTIWWNQICKLTRHESVDYTTGLRTVGYDNCRRHNSDGNCRRFEAVIVPSALPKKCLH